MRVVLSTIAKFHFFDLARQLHQRGMLERIFTGYPRWKLGGEEIPDERISTFPWLMVPRMALPRFGLLPQWLERPLNNASHVLHDRHVAANLPTCDVFHGLSRYNLEAGRAAQAKGARYICDVASSHMLTQDRLSREEWDIVGLPFAGFDPRGVERELAEYESADSITLPSEFAVRSFLDHGVPADKIAKVPFGVDLSRFHPVDIEDDGVFRVGFVGALSVRKGIHHLARAFALADIPNSELVLIGSPQRETEKLLEPARGMRVVRTGHVPQPQPKTWFSRFQVKVLPSIEDGFGYVLLQAQACGCPVIATHNTGGPDCIEDGVNGFLVPIRDPEAIAEKLVYLAGNPDAQRAMGQAALERSQRVDTWDRYGARMVEHYARVSGG